MLIRMACAVKEKNIRSQLETHLEDADVQLKFKGRSKVPWRELVSSCADLFLISRALVPKPIDASIAVLNQLPEKPIIIILHDRDSAEDMANITAAGADVVLYSGTPMISLIEAIESTLESRRQFHYADRFDNRGRFLPRLNDFESQSRHMQVFLEETRHVVGSDAGILLLGETGVGKEHLSRAIHTESDRSSGPFVPVNMAAIPEQLMESELFGHEQGAFTGAVRSRRGAFELAHGGTLFLDEIGEMPLLMQSKLLRVLQDFEFTPVGGETPVWVNVRIIAATNRNLEKEIEKGNFRRDLYYRLGVITLTLPPLRKRKEDIPSMASHFLRIIAQKIGREVNRISKDAMDALCDYSWPGNIRELMNVIERAALLCRSREITLSDLPGAFLQKGPTDTELTDFNPVTWEGKSLAQVKEAVVSLVERRYLEMALEKSYGRVGEAARMAGIHPRGLYGKMKKFGLDKANFKQGRT
ncbi:MAG TPA: sigma-54-dependent Fis family transcriptional regulator [Desulfobacteraceae bacterium]|nr:sigma-54-dependent Fis family transcriptional regulator [Desulfobacteraceae bacterium]